MNKFDKEILKTARSYIGTSFQHQGRKKSNGRFKGGIDCIGLIICIAQELKIKNKDNNLLSSFDQKNYSNEPDGKTLKNNFDSLLEPVKEISENTIIAKIGLFKILKYPQHCGIISKHPSGGLSLIHAYQNSGKVVEHIFSKSWQEKAVGYYHFSKPDNL